jgi:hypothetical protein
VSSSGCNALPEGNSCKPWLEITLDSTGWLGRTGTGTSGGVISFNKTSAQSVCRSAGRYPRRHIRMACESILIAEDEEDSRNWLFTCDNGEVMTPRPLAQAHHKKTVDRP